MFEEDNAKLAARREQCERRGHAYSGEMGTSAGHSFRVCGNCGDVYSRKDNRAEFMRRFRACEDHGHTYGDPIPADEGRVLEACTYCGHVNDRPEGMPSH